MELVVIDVVQKHVHAGKVVGGVVDFLPEEAFFDDVLVKLFFRLQEQAARAASGVVDFVDFLLPVHRQPRNQFGDALRGEKFAAGFACVGSVVGNQVFVGIAEKVDVVVFKIAEIEFRHAFEDGGKAFVLVGNGAAESAAGGVEVVKQTFNVLFGRIAGGGAFNRGKNFFQLGVELFVLMGFGGNIAKKLAGVDEIAFDFDGIVFDFGRDDAVGHSGIINTAVASLHIVGEVFADKAVEKCAENVLFKVPAVHRTTYFVRDFPDLAVQLGALLYFGHNRNLYKS